MVSSWKDGPQAAALLALMVVPPDKVSQTAVVQIDNGFIKKIIEKPVPENAVSNIASLPIYIFSPVIADFLENIEQSPRGEFELQDAIQALIDHHESVRGVIIEERLNLTSIDDLLQLNLYFLNKEKPTLVQEPVSIGKNVLLLPPYVLGPRTVIEDQTIIGPNVYIESDCHIGSDCQVANAVFLKGSRLGNSQIRNMGIFY
jgi:glucose-1-phosphate thymidylyltransferase